MPNKAEIEAYRALPPTPTAQPTDAGTLFVFMPGGWHMLWRTMAA